MSYELGVLPPVYSVLTYELGVLPPERPVLGEEAGVLQGGQLSALHRHHPAQQTLPANLTDTLNNSSKLLYLVKIERLETSELI